jgi:hypothetical protein
VVYGPLYLYWLWLCLKARSFFFFNASNPSITNGGFLMESKKQIYDLLPWQYYPNTMFVKAQTPLKEILVEIRRKNFAFPLIAKPDIGMKGLSVKKLCSKDELFEYAIQSRVDFLVQSLFLLTMKSEYFTIVFPTKKGVTSPVL